ncbi:histidine phosphatase family protein [Candidatus Woesearchaeota archaeon]|nr:histidine phosphatase family protein [Candidatus Woesearchaeota archaeon]
MTLIYLVRHGETEQMAGISDVDNLTRLGKQQGRRLALRFAKARLDEIYASKQHRAHETAKLVRKNHPRIKFVVTPELREIYGPVIGSTPAHYRPERHPKDLARARRVFKRFFRPGKKRILLVCHGNLIGYLLGEVLGFPRKKRKVLPVFPTSLSIVGVKRTAGKIRMGVLRFNDTTHLSERLQNGSGFFGLPHLP